MLWFIYLLCPGVPWRLHIWLESLQGAQRLCRDEVTVSLLTEFPSIRTEDYSPELLSTGVPLMFGMLETSKVQLNTSLRLCPSVCAADSVSFFTWPGFRSIFYLKCVSAIVVVSQIST